METVMVTLKHAKAKKLLMDLEELDLIQITEDPFLPKALLPSKISDLKNMMVAPLDNDLIDQQLAELRSEWDRNF